MKINSLLDRSQPRAGSVARVNGQAHKKSCPFRPRRPAPLRG